MFGRPEPVKYYWSYGELENVLAGYFTESTPNPRQNRESAITRPYRTFYWDTTWVNFVTLMSASEVLDAAHDTGSPRRKIPSLMGAQFEGETSIERLQINRAMLADLAKLLYDFVYFGSKEARPPRSLDRSKIVKPTPAIYANLASSLIDSAVYRLDVVRKELDFVRKERVAARERQQALLREQKERELQRRAHEIAQRNAEIEERRIADLPRVYTSQAQNLDQLVAVLPKHVENLEHHTISAENNLRRRAFSSFWESVEQAYFVLSNFNQDIARIYAAQDRLEVIRRDIDTSGQLLDFFPQRIFNDQYDVVTILTDRIIRAVDTASTDYQFASIWEIRRNTSAIARGFSLVNSTFSHGGSQISQSFLTLAKGIRQKK